MGDQTVHRQSPTCKSDISDNPSIQDSAYSRACGLPEAL